jgi:hypothetical protein
MTRKAAKLMLVAAATFVWCVPKLYYYLWLWGGKH